MSVATTRRALALLSGLLLAGAAAAQERGHYHHVHLNVADVERSSAFYQRSFGVAPLQYAGRVPALLADRARWEAASTAAAADARARFGRDEIVSQYESLYRSALDG